jgi:hypothetical protein
VPLQCVVQEGTEGEGFRTAIGSWVGHLRCPSVG